MTRKIKDLYTLNGFINALDDTAFLKGKWAHNQDAPVCDLNLLDNYILMQVGNSHVSKLLDTDNIYTYIRTCINANEYRLNSMWESILVEFNPIENYDRYEEETSNSSNNMGARTTTINAGEHKTSTQLGAREQTNTNGQQKATTENHTTAFDSTDYAKATDKSATTYDGYTDKINTNQATDTTTQNAYTDTSTQNAVTDTNSNSRTSHIHGNIGVVDAPTMLTKFREVSVFSFYDAFVKLLEDYIIEMNYEMEDF